MKTMLFSAVAVAALSGTAHAQSTDSPDSPQTGETSGLGEIVVTAQKRSENLQDVPIAISAISAERTEALQMTRLKDLGFQTPNVSFDLGALGPSVYIRGIGGGGRNIGFSTRAGVYLDGVYVGQASALQQPLLDVDRVEVLRGPQGTLFGKNTDAGAINIITRTPSPDFSATFAGGVGNHNGWQTSVLLNTALAENVYFKIGGGIEKRDGFIKNLFDGDKRLGQLDNHAIRAGLRWLANDRLTVDVSADYSYDDSMPVGTEAESGTFGGTVDPFAPKRFETNTDYKKINRFKSRGTSLTLNYELGGGQTITSITAYRTSSVLKNEDNDYRPTHLLNTTYLDKSKQFTQELRIASPTTDRLRYVAGAFYSRDKLAADRFAVFGPDAVAFGIADGAVTPIFADIQVLNYAAFANLTFDATEWLKFDGGLRYTREERDLVYDFDGSAAPLFNFATVTNFRDKANENQWTPSVSVTVKPARDISLYARYARGTKGGGWNVDFLSKTQVIELSPGKTPFEYFDESVDAYEIGFKGEFFDRRLRANIAVFDQRFKNFQIGQRIQINPTTATSGFTNAAEVISRGVELELDAKPVKALTLHAAIGYLDAKFGDSPGTGFGGANSKGLQLPFVSKWSGSFSGDLRIPVSSSAAISFLGEYIFRSSVANSQSLPPTAPFFPDGYRLPGYDLVNGSISLRTANDLEVSLWARNLFNKFYWLGRAADTFGTGISIYGERRTFGIKVKKTFN